MTRRRVVLTITLEACFGSESIDKQRRKRRLAQADEGALWETVGREG